MEVDEFRRVLHNGLGRAIVYLKQHDTAPYREVILHACTHNTTYEPMWNGKFQYLYEVIQLAGKGRAKFYHRKVLEALLNSPTYPNEESNHLFGLAWQFVARGDEDMRQAMYVQVAKNIGAGYDTGLDKLVGMDGLRAFLFASDMIGKAQITPELARSGRHLVHELEERYGKEKAQARLSQVSESNPNVKAYLQAIEDNQTKREPDPVNLKAGYSDFRPILQNLREEISPYWFGRWGKEAPDDDFEAAPKIYWRKIIPMYWFAIVPS